MARIKRALRTSSMTSLLLAVLFVAVTCAQPPEKHPDTKFSSFWLKFRAAVVANDTRQIVSMTKFPFETRGGDDSDPVVKHNQSSFLKLYDKLLRQDAGLRAESETMKQFIERKTSLSDKETDEKSASARVASFVFEKVQGQWWFTRAYVEE